MILCNERWQRTRAPLEDAKRYVWGACTCTKLVEQAIGIRTRNSEQLLVGLMVCTKKHGQHRLKGQTT